MKKTSHKYNQRKNWLIGIILCSILCLGFFIISTDSISLIQETLSHDTLTVNVEGNSMEPRIKNGQAIKYIPGYYKDHPLKRGDIVIANVAAHSGLIIKEVVAVSGDHWTYSGGNLTVNNELLRNSAGVAYNIHSPMLTLYADSYPTLPIDTALILGDQPSGTLDASKFGLIGIGEIVGKVVEY